MSKITTTQSKEPGNHRKKNVVLNPRIRNSQQNKESESDAPEGEVDSNGTLEDSNINIPECETSNVEANIVSINRGITSLAPTAPPSQKKRQQQQQQQQQQTQWPQKLQQ